MLTAGFFTPRSPGRESLVLTPARARVACVLNPLPTDPVAGFAFRGMRRTEICLVGGLTGGQPLVGAVPSSPVTKRGPPCPAGLSFLRVLGATMKESLEVNRNA